MTEDTHRPPATTTPGPAHATPDDGEMDALPIEVLRIRIVGAKNRNGFVALCQFPGSEEFVLQYFKVMVHTSEEKPGELEFSRSKSAVKQYGRMNADGEIISK